MTLKIAMTFQNRVSTTVYIRFTYNSFTWTYHITFLKNFIWIQVSKIVIKSLSTVTILSSKNKSLKILTQPLRETNTCEACWSGHETTLEYRRSEKMKSNPGGCGESSVRYPLTQLDNFNAFRSLKRKYTKGSYRNKGKIRFFYLP